MDDPDSAEAAALLAGADWNAAAERFWPRAQCKSDGRTDNVPLDWYTAVPFDIEPCSSIPRRES